MLRVLLLRGRALALLASLWGHSNAAAKPAHLVLVAAGAVSLLFMPVLPLGLLLPAQHHPERAANQDLPPREEHRRDDAPRVPRPAPPRPASIQAWNKRRGERRRGLVTAAASGFCTRRKPRIVVASPLFLHPIEISVCLMGLMDKMSGATGSPAEETRAGKLSGYTELLCPTHT